MSIGPPATCDPPLAPLKEIHPGLVVHVRLPDGHVVHARAGAASVELATPIGLETVMNVGSVAKQITAYLAVLSARHGTLDLHAPAASILPRLRVADVTIVDLIRHDGGIRDAESMLSLAGFRELDHYTVDDLLELAYRQRERAVAPGRFLYSNTSYLLLAKILGTIHGTGLQQLADKLVFAPLGMRSARFKTDPRQVIPYGASSYGQAPTGAWEHQERPVALPGPGSLWCSAPDLDRWLGHLHQCWAGQSADAFPFDAEVGYLASDHPPYRYGAGLYAGSRTSSGGAVFHYGHEHGFSAAVHLTRAGLRVTCLSNRADVRADHVLARILDHLAQGDARRDIQAFLNALVIADAATPKPRTATPPAQAPAETDPHTWLGAFTCDQVPGILRLSRHGEDLYLWRRGARDRLADIDGRSYAGPGYTLTFSAGAGIGELTLDLDRAPGLRYQLVPGSDASV